MDCAAFVLIETVMPEKDFDENPQKKTTANESPGKKNHVDMVEEEIVEEEIAEDELFARPMSCVQGPSGKVIPKRKL